MIGRKIWVGFYKGPPHWGHAKRPSQHFDWEEAVILERNELWTKVRTSHGHVTVVSRGEYEARLKYS